jgi:hypothetical protein
MHLSVAQQEAWWKQGDIAFNQVTPLIKETATLYCKVLLSLHANFGITLRTEDTGLNQIAVNKVSMQRSYSRQEPSRQVNINLPKTWVPQVNMKQGKGTEGIFRGLEELFWIQ